MAEAVVVMGAAVVLVLEALSPLPQAATESTAAAATPAMASLLVRTRITPRFT
ncbi:hypothetical protein [Actinosynnema sp. NPDC023587]|uniref:hypothetical protein n=1 Tax=Actinosynnema sp. NPDC023587 TaxID=3154695 RepID=UPI0033C4E2E4